MTHGRHARRRRQHESPQEKADPPEENGDFADEHATVTFADEMAGGPEGSGEPESPSGKGGPGGMDPKSSGS